MPRVHVGHKHTMLAQIRGGLNACKYIDTEPRDTGDKLVRAASDASDEAAIES